MYFKTDQTANSGVTKASEPDGTAGLLSHIYTAGKDFAKNVLETFPKASVGNRGGTLIKKTIVAGILLF